MDYVENVRKDVFFLEQMIRQEQMKRYIQECQIFASGKDIAYKLNTLNEDLKDSANSLWTKIKTIFNRIWLKFLERIDHFCKSDAEYLKQYQKIILNKKVPEATFTMPDYSKVKDRCFKLSPEFVSIVNPNFITEMHNKAKAGVGIETEAIEKSKDEWRLALRQAIGKAFGMSESDIKEDTDFPALTKEFFGGGESIEISSSEVNMTDAYNLCFSAEVFIKNLKRDQTNFDKWIGDIEKKYNADYKAFMDAVRKDAEVKKHADSNAGSTEHKNDIKTAASNELKKFSDDEEKKKAGIDDEALKNKAEKHYPPTTVHNNSFNLYSVVYDRVLNEVEISSSSGKSGGDDSINKGGGAATNASSVNSTETNRKIDTAMKADAKDQESKKDDVSGAAGAYARTHANNELNQDDAHERLTEKNVTAFTNLVTAYTTMATETFSTIFGAKCNAIEKMRKDYMSIIRFHVKYWLGRPNNVEDNVTPQAATSGAAPGLGMSR